MNQNRNTRCGLSPIVGQDRITLYSARPRIFERFIPSRTDNIDCPNCGERVVIGIPTGHFLEDIHRSSCEKGDRSTCPKCNMPVNTLVRRATWFEAIITVILAISILCGVYLMLVSRSSNHSLTGIYGVILVSTALICYLNLLSAYPADFSPVISETHWKRKVVTESIIMVILILLEQYIGLEKLLESALVISYIFLVEDLVALATPAVTNYIIPEPIDKFPEILILLIPPFPRFMSGVSAALGVYYGGVSYQVVLISLSLIHI